MPEIKVKQVVLLAKRASFSPEKCLPVKVKQLVLLLKKILLCGIETLCRHANRLFVLLSLTLATQHVEGIESQGLHLVLAGEAANGGEEADALTQTADDVL